MSRPVSWRKSPFSRYQRLDCAHTACSTKQAASGWCALWWATIPIAVGSMLALLSTAGATPTFGQAMQEESSGLVHHTISDAGRGRDVETELCLLVEAAAAVHDLPIGFFTRLLWKESRFQADAISPKGAQGIAQFMPQTAAERGVLDPFDVHEAIPASAGLLSDLKARFGNLGLAAAAYNAGPTRVTAWLADEGSALPWETQDFVLAITGMDAETWADGAGVPTRQEAEEDCKAVLATVKVPGQDLGPAIATERAPWGVQVTGNFSQSRALSAYSRLQARFSGLIGDRKPMVIGGRMPGRGKRVFYRVRVPVATRPEGESLCNAIRQAGGHCIVLKTI